jgi:chromate transporter
VILNLSIWFALHVMFETVHEHALGPMRLLVPDWRTIDPAAVAIAVAALIAMFRYKHDMLTVLAASSAAGLAYTLLAQAA